jgi:hypothetical protein
LHCKRPFVLAEEEGLLPARQGQAHKAARDPSSAIACAFLNNKRPAALQKAFCFSGGRGITPCAPGQAHKAARDPSSAIACAFLNNKRPAALQKAFCFSGGRGIRTPGPVSRTTVFKTAAFDHSAIPPIAKVIHKF